MPKIEAGAKTVALWNVFLKNHIFILNPKTNIYDYQMNARDFCETLCP